MQCQETSTASDLAVAVFCSGRSLSANASKSARVMQRDAVPGGVVTLGLNSSEANVVNLNLISTPGDMGAADWGPGTWTVRLNVTTAQSNWTWTECHICRISSSGASLATVGSATALGIGLGTTGVKTATATGSRQTANITDRVAIVFVFSNAQAMANTAGVTLDQLVDMPDFGGVSLGLRAPRLARAPILGYGTTYLAVQQPAVLPSVGQLFTADLMVATTSGVSLVKQANKNLSVVTSSAVSLVKQVVKNLSIAATSAVSVIKSTAKALAVAASSAVTLTAMRLILVALSVATSSVASVTKQVGKVLSVASTSAVSIAKLASKVLSIATASVASLVTLKARFVTLAVATTSAVSLQKQIGKLLSIGAGSQPVLIKQVGKVLSVAAASAKSLTALRIVLINLTVATTSVPRLVKQVGKNLAVATSSTPSIVKTVGKGLLVNVASVAGLVAEFVGATGPATTLRAYVISAESPTAVSSSASATSKISQEPPTGTDTTVRGQ